jgi:bifunctional non-homologous end joining protein LigD
LSLEKYNVKRNFHKTSEPAGVYKHAMLKTGLEAGVYVIHKHKARSLHYDLRLEWEGTLKSWAIPKGPSLDPAQKRLAVEVEDHPLEYASFEGVIPEGEYGAGQVIVWDRGTFSAAPGHGAVGEMLEKGSLKVVIRGEKLKGGFALVKTAWKGAKRNWLLIKEKDDDARPGSDITAEQPRSLISGRAIADP